MQRKRIAAIIPARMSASRFPGKPLVDILGIPMIEHVRRRVCLSDVVDDVFVATCDNEIAKVVDQNGGNYIMTASSHERCTDRVEEAAQKIQYDIIMNVQGDEPLLEPDVLGLLVDPLLENDTTYCTNLLSVIRKKDDLSNMDIIKTVLDQNNFVMYYSRAPIPYFVVHKKCQMFRQTGLSAFTKSFLTKYSNLLPTPLETTESIDFLRILEHGHSVQGVIYNKTTVGVDREEDVENVERILQEDPIQNRLYNRILQK